MILSPSFWEWFNIWLIQFMKDLYHEIKMVALRGSGNSINPLSHAYVNHGNQLPQSTLDVAQSLQTSLNMPQSAVAQHLNANQINLRPLNNVSLRYMPQQNNPNSLKHEQPSSRYSNSNCVLPSQQQHYRLLRQIRPECYHPAGTTGAAYMPSTAGGAQTSTPAALRVPPTPQPSAPPAPPQDMSKTTMAGHNYVTAPNQTPPTRSQYPNFQFRAPQHGSRPNTHPRQQQPYLPGAAATATGPVMYHPTFVLGPTHMGMPPSFQQPRSNTQGYYQYTIPYLGYSTPSHTPPYYYTSNNQQIPTPNLPASAPGGRSNPTTLVGPQGTLATPTAPTATIPPPQAPTHMHQTIPGIRPSQPKRPSYAVPIIDPVTQQDIFSGLYSNDSQYGGDSNERQTPQPEPTHSIAEEFTRRVSEVANQSSTSESALKSNYVKNTNESSAPTSSIQLQANTITPINNNVEKSEILTVNESKSLGPADVAVEHNETPVVSAISDSPVIVPKMPTNVKQLQKNSDQNISQSVVEKSLPSNKQHKQSKSKPVVPLIEDVEKPSEVVTATVTNVCALPVTSAAPSAAPAPAPVHGPAPSPASAPAPAPAPVAAAAPAPTLAPATVATPIPSVPAANPQPVSTAAPQPQRIPRERVKSEEKDKPKDKEVIPEKETTPVSSKPNGPTATNVIGSVDNLAEIINQTTSQTSQANSTEATKKQVTLKQLSPAPETELSSIVEAKCEVPNNSETLSVPSPTPPLLASIEKAAAKELHTVPELVESHETSSAIQAQAKLTQSIASVQRHNPESKMKDINLNNKTTDADTANGNPTDVAKSETAKEDINKNEKVVKNSKNTSKKSGNKMANSETNVKEAESFENGKNETDKVSNVEQEEQLSKIEESPAQAPVAETPEAPAAAPVAVPKYNYNPGQWSPFNTSGKKCYDIGLLKQMKDDPLSKNKPNVPLLEACNVMRTTPIQDALPFTAISRPMNDSLFPQFAKSSVTGSRSNTPRDPKKDGRNIAAGGKGSAKLSSQASSSGGHKPIYVSLSLREEVKLNETKDPWKPLRFKKENLSEDDFKTQELYKKFRGILNKLTPQKFDTLLDKVKTLEINNRERLEGVIDLVFEKAIDEPNFSEAYAAMCNKLSMLKVPADNATHPGQCVNFRGLIISRCQNQFVTDKTDEQVQKLEKELEECTDPAKKKELQLQLEEENRRVRMRSVGNVRFIGELYKLKMLTSKIMVYCMNYLIDKLEEEKLECLCKLLTTIGEQVESEVREPLENVFKKMQDIVDRKSNKISSRVRFMIQDVIELRRRRWVQKSVVDSQPKMMDQIQKEAEQQQRHIELMNATSSGVFRRDDGNRGKRGDNRRQGGNNAFPDNSWKSTPRPNYTVDTSKLKAVTQKNQNLNNIKLAPTNSGWNQGSGTKNTTQVGSNSTISLSKNKYILLENVHTDPTTLKGNKDMSPSYHSKGASIERSTFNSRGDFNSGSGGKSGSMGVARSNSSSRSPNVAPISPAPAADAPAPAPVKQERLPDNRKKTVKAMIDLLLMNPDDDEMVVEMKRFEPQYHADVVTEILNVVLEKPAKEVAMVAKSLLHLVSTNTITADNFLAGMKEILEIAPDLHIDVPMLYDYLGKFFAPQIEKKHITFVQILRLSEVIISSNHGHLLLKSVIKELKESMGPSFVKSKWQDSGLQLKEWMNEDQVEKWLIDNKFEFLEGSSNTCEEIKKILTPAETQSKLLQLMNSDENCDCIKGWVQDNLGKSSNEDWFMRALIQAICEHALFGPEGRDVPHFNQDRMNKYSRLINEFGESQQSREASCLFGIQQLIHRLEHPQGLSLEIFQYLHEQYIISPEGFISWEESELEPEGRGVMMKALTSFFTNLKEADNEDSCSED